LTLLLEARASITLTQDLEGRPILGELLRDTALGRQGMTDFGRCWDYWGEEEGGGVRSGPGAARTIPLFHTISARPPKQSRMVRTFLKVHTRPRLANALMCRGY
jgi:hypothetical protein